MNNPPENHPAKNCVIKQTRDAASEKSQKRRCRFSRDLFVFLFFSVLFSWPLLTIFEGSCPFFVFLYFFIAWLVLIVILLFIRQSALKCLGTEPGEQA